MSKEIQEATVVHAFDHRSASMSGVRERINSGIKNGVSQYNTVYRQASTNLLVAAGILLAFSTQFIEQLGQATLPVKIMGGKYNHIFKPIACIWSNSTTHGSGLFS
jgi:hypothetical protein